ncbi:MAG: quinolinate synthase NadA [bacterium]
MFKKFELLPDQKKIIKEIKKLKKDRDAVIIVHNYQRPEVQEIGDILGDSLALSRAAAKTKEKVIVFCGVHFMAESAAILCPGKTVLLPETEAGCPMAEMVTAKKLQEFRENYPGAKVVCYVNSSAEVKAASDICCTSSNATKVVQSIKDTNEIIFIPDKNLAHYTSSFTEKKIIPWNGFCPTHHRLKPEDVLKAKENYPNATVIAHPECKPSVLALVDYVLSTEGMVRYSKETKAKEIIVCTEVGMLYRLQKENPGKKFYSPLEEMICPNMKLNTLESVFNSLEKMEHVVTVPEEIRLKAKIALDRMLEIV